MGVTEGPGFGPDDNQAFEQLVSKIPKLFKPKSNPGWKSLLTALGQGDLAVQQAIAATKAQLFTQSASGIYLNRLGANVGVGRPAIGMVDSDYANLIPVMSYLPKQLRETIQQLLRIWYGDAAIRASATAGNAEPYSLANGQTLTLTVDGSPITFTVNSIDYAKVSAAKAQEVADAINKQFGNETILAFSRPDVTNLNHVNIASDTIGATGSVLVTGGTAAAAFGFPTTIQTINSLAQPAVLYEVNNDEVVVILPSSPAVVTRLLPGAIHFNANKNGTLQQGYVFNPKAAFSISGLSATTQTAITKDSVLTNILVNSLPSAWPAKTGYFVIDFGLSTQEGPIRYITVPNSFNLVVDPSYVFVSNHVQGATINYVNGLGGPNLRTDGTSFAAYITGLASARQALENLITAATAVGVVVRFVVHEPTYRFSSPALDTNLAV